jgi:hypothetical protein
MADGNDERAHQASVLREMAERIADGSVAPFPRELWLELLRAYSDRVSADSARRLRTELDRRQSDVDVDTAAQLRAQLEARRGKPPDEK